MIYKNKFIYIFWALLAAASCRKEPRYIYVVEQQELYQNAAQKTNLKSTAQFIAIAYNDLFGASITNDELLRYDIALQSVGDKNTMQDMIVRALLNRSGVKQVSNEAMRADIEAFIRQEYLRFYNREPGAYEIWKLKDMIEKNTDITPKMVYYSFMTADEYKYY
ncbi:MAG: hypothetical protein NZM35_11705 [Chitinophagales bacterium]|nr:hypothetical protein [Chitinophagales bacterium]MDW8419252.1 hypothetical protein [Chitinophagales bacterium]